MSEHDGSTALVVEPENKSHPVARRRPFFCRPAFALAAMVIVFLGVGIWNLGATRFPHSDYTPKLGTEEVYFDLGSAIRVDRVFLLVQDGGKVDVDLYSGSPDNWAQGGNLSMSGGYREWRSIDVRRDTRYVRLVFKGSSGRIGEALMFADDKKLEIVNVVGQAEGGAAAALTDEQALIDNPTSHKSGSYFDEIYFARTAEEHLKLQEPFEWSHPPLGKEMISFGMMIFGYTPFGSRISGVVFGALIIVLVYFLASRLFNSTRAGLIAAFLITFDFMHFVEARIGTGETFLLLFITCMVYFFYRYLRSPGPDPRNLFLGVVFFGFSFSVKWVAINVFVGLVILMLLLKWRKALYRKEVIWFSAGVLAAAGVYMLTYIPYFFVGHQLEHNLGDWWRLQFSMYHYHADLTADHPFGSDWWAWPLMLRPLWLYSGSFAGKTAQIVSFGNSALWWPAMPMMLGAAWIALGAPRAWLSRIPGTARSLWLIFKPVDKAALLILVPFLTQWLLFVPIRRVTFIYHFYPSVLFLALVSTLWMNRLWDKGKWRWLVIGYLGLNVAAFAFFYPVISGHPMGQGYWDSLKWLLAWVL